MMRQGCYVGRGVQGGGPAVNFRGETEYAKSAAGGRPKPVLTPNTSNQASAAHRVSAPGSLETINMCQHFVRNHSPSALRQRAEVFSASVTVAGATVTARGPSVMPAAGLLHLPVTAQAAVGLGFTVSQAWGFVVEGCRPWVLPLSDSRSSPGI